MQLVWIYEIVCIFGGIIRQNDQLFTIFLNYFSGGPFEIKER